MRRLTAIAALALVVVGLDLWVMMGDVAAVPFTLWPLKGSLSLPPAVVVLLGVIIGLSAATFWNMIRSTPAADPLSPGQTAGTEQAAKSTLVVATGIIVATSAGILLVAASVLDKINPVTAALAYGLGWLAALATVHAFRALSRGEGVAFDSYWGGLGGAQGGWRVSPVTVTLVLALVLVAGTVAVATGTGPIVEPGDQAADSNTADDGGEEEPAEANKAAGNEQ